MSNSCFWVLGRGASIAYGLEWTVPKVWYDDLDTGVVPRDDLVDRIKQTLRHEMDQPSAHGNAYQRLIEELSRRTSNGWYHRFLTTNWDTLLEKELNPYATNYVTAHGALPRWLGNQSHVYHLNGTIEEEPPVGEGTGRLRSPFLLETDPPEERVATVEANQAFHKLLISTCVVMVGLSFACATDQSLLGALSHVQDKMPVGEATVYIVNPDQHVLSEVRDRVRAALPASDFVLIEKGFEAFIEDGLTELVGTVLQ